MHNKFAREGFLPWQTHWLAALQLLCLLQPVEDRIYTRSDVSDTSAVISLAISIAILTNYT